MLPLLPQPFRQELWTKRGVSTLLRWAALQLYPWFVDDERLHDALTKICRALYGRAVDLSDPCLSSLLVSHVRMSYFL